MNSLKQAILDIKNDENLAINGESHKLEQKTRNRYKTLITEALLADISNAINELGVADNDVIIGRIEKGIGVGIRTEYGYIPVFLEASMKGLDFDVELAAQDYKDKMTEKAEKAAASLEQKKLKMEQDAEKRAKKQAERERLEAEKLARLEAQAKGER